MKKILLLSLVLAYSCLSLLSQNKYKISGTVLGDSDKEAVIQAGVKILNSKDSAYVTGTATNVNGKFSLSVNPGKYILGVTYIGYKDSYHNVDATKGSVDLHNIYIKENGILLSEAVVTAKAAEIAIKGDTVEYNADSYKVQESAVVEDLLKKIPGAEVDSEGKITINGKEITKILVDGKEFFSSDPKVASKNLPAQMVDKLQVLDKKSDMAQMTGFDDGEEETVINLTVKKGMKEGLFGNATAGFGNDDRYGLSGIANYIKNENQFTLILGSNNTNNAGFTDNSGNTFRRSGGLNFGGRNGISKSTNGGFNFSIKASDKLKWGGNIRFGDTNNEVTSNTYKERYSSSDRNGDINKNQYTNGSGFGKNKSSNYGADFRFEWTPDSLTTIIFSPNLQFGENKNWQSENQLTTYFSPSDTINWGYSDSYSKGKTTSASARLEVSRQLGKKGRVLSFSFSGSLSDQNSDGTNLSNTTYRFLDARSDSISYRDQIYDQKNKNNYWRAFASYVEPIGRNNFIQLNYSIKNSYSESDRNTFLNDGDDIYSIIDTTSTKRLENEFINQQIALNFKAVRAKYNYTIGLALQPSSSRTTTIIPRKNDSKVSNNVLNFAPVVQFNYLWDKRHNLRINYNGRTTQATTTQLSDVRDESNPNNVTYGNPNLKPSFSNNFRLRYQKFNPENASAFMAFGGFTFSTNDIVSSSKQFENGSRETTYRNVSGNWNANLRVIFNRPLKNKKFSISSMSYGYYAVNNSYVNEDKNISKSTTLTERFGIQYRSDLFDAGLRGNLSYSNINNNLNGDNNSNIYTYGGTFNTTWYLPYGITIDTDVNYSANSGLSDRYNLNQWVWNASISKQIFKTKTGTIRLNFYDILNQNQNISFSQSSNTFSQSMTNSLGRYFMFSFSYKFQMFKGGAKMSDLNNTPIGGDDFRRGRDGGGRPSKF